MQMVAGGDDRPRTYLSVAILVNVDHNLGREGGVNVWSGQTGGVVGGLPVRSIR